MHWSAGAGSCRWSRQPMRPRNGQTLRYATFSRPFGTWAIGNCGPNVETLGYCRAIPPGSGKRVDALERRSRFVQVVSPAHAAEEWAEFAIRNIQPSLRDLGNRELRTQR